MAGMLFSSPRKKFSYTRKVSELTNDSIVDTSSVFGDEFEEDSISNIIEEDIVDNNEIDNLDSSVDTAQDQDFNNEGIRNINSYKTAQEYFMDHRPGDSDYGAPLHDITGEEYGMYPKDFYDMPHIYDFGEPGSKGAIEVMKNFKGRPDDLVDMYRAVPDDGPDNFNTGDWVGISEDYAKAHGESNLDNKYKILRQQVPARELWTNADSVNEWGYHGPNVDSIVSHKTAADETPSELQKLYRGVRLYPDPEDEQRIRQTISDGVSGVSMDTIGNQLTVGPEILDMMNEHGGLGTHWSTRPEIAERFSLQSGGDGSGIPIMLTTDWDGQGEDHDRTGTGGSSLDSWKDEAEITLLPETELNINSMIFGPSFSEGYEILNDSQYESYADDFAAHGREVPRGGPQVRFAGKKTSKEETVKEIESPGNIYRGIGSDALTDDEYNIITDWAKSNEYDPDNFSLVEPNYEMIYPILERLEEEQGLGRHWSTSYNVARGFGDDSANDLNDEAEWDEDGRENFSILFRGDWDGQGQDLGNWQPGYDGESRPSNLKLEEEVTLNPGTEVDLMGIELYRPQRGEPRGKSVDIPTPNIKVRASLSREENNMVGVEDFIRFAKNNNLDPQNHRTAFHFKRTHKTSSTQNDAINAWIKSQLSARKTAKTDLSQARATTKKTANSTWVLDHKLSAYVSKTQQKFACGCGGMIEVPSYTNCKCGSVWNAYKVSSATKGDEMFLVRQVPVRENVLVANQRLASRRGKQYAPAMQKFARPTVQDALSTFPDWQVVDDNDSRWQINSPDGLDSITGEDDGSFLWYTDFDTDDEFHGESTDIADVIEEMEASKWNREKNMKKQEQDRHETYVSDMKNNTYW